MAPPWYHTTAPCHEKVPVRATNHNAHIEVTASQHDIAQGCSPNPVSPAPCPRSATRCEPTAESGQRDYWEHWGSGQIPLYLPPEVSR